MTETEKLIKQIRGYQPRRNKWNAQGIGSLIDVDFSRKVGRNNWLWLQINYPEAPGALTRRENTGLLRWVNKVGGDAQKIIDKARYADLVELVKNVDMSTFEDKVRPWVAIGRFFNDNLMVVAGLSRIEVQRRLTMIASQGLVMEVDINYIEGRVHWIDYEQETLPF